MIVIGVILSVFGIGFLCWLLFNLAVYALPFFAGMTASLAAYHSGAGIIRALLLGFSGGAVTLVAVQIAFAAVDSPVLRGAVAILFATPATIAGYHATLALAHIGVPSATWRGAFAIVGAIFIGGTAFVRVAAMTSPPAARRDWRFAIVSFTPIAQNLADSVSVSLQGEKRGYGFNRLAKAGDLRNDTRPRRRRICLGISAP